MGRETGATGGVAGPTDLSNLCLPRDTYPMHRTTEQLEQHLDHIRAAPADGGIVEMVVRRPAEDSREAVDSAELDSELGMVGDNWLERAKGYASDGPVQKYAQLTLMNSRVTHAVAVERDRWPLAGDQIYVDLDLSIENLPAGTRLQVGSAVVEISEAPHTGCDKFAGRFGAPALRFVNVGEGRERRLRGVNTEIIESGTVSVGDTVKKI